MCLARTGIKTLGVGVWIVFVGSGCGGSMASLPTIPHDDEDFLEVPYPPPAIRAEQVPSAGESGAVWIDGEWIWRQTRWSWSKGAYVVPPQGSHLARWETLREEGKVRHAPTMFRVPGSPGVSVRELKRSNRKRPAENECMSPASPASSTETPRQLSSCISEQP